MSTIDLAGNHSVVSYVAGVTKPLSGQRLSVVYWKTGKDGIKKESKCVSIPKIEGITPEELQLMVPHVMELLAQAQNKIIRESIEAGKTTILGEDISVAKCISYMNEVGSSETAVRLTTESLTQWYVDTLEAPVMLAVAAKLGISEDTEPTAEQSQKVEAISKKYKETIGKLASGAFKLPADYAEMVKKVVSFAPSEDAIRVKLEGKLDKMLKVSDEDMMMAL